MKFNDLKNKVKDTSAKQKSVTDHFPTVATTKENFSHKYAKWVVADNMPLKSGESSVFKGMIRSQQWQSGNQLLKASTFLLQLTTGLR
jgi:hypothetical protein